MHSSARMLVVFHWAVRARLSTMRTQHHWRRSASRGSRVRMSLTSRLTMRRLASRTSRFWSAPCLALLGRACRHGAVRAASRCTAPSQPRRAVPICTTAVSAELACAPWSLRPPPPQGGVVAGRERKRTPSAGSPCAIVRQQTGAGEAAGRERSCASIVGLAPGLQHSLLHLLVGITVEVAQSRLALPVVVLHPAGRQCLRAARRGAPLGCIGGGTVCSPSGWPMRRSEQREPLESCST